jgi:chitodextrinase
MWCGVIAVLLMLWPAVADAQNPSWAHVQNRAQNVSAATNTVVLDRPTTAGNLIVVEVDWSDQATFLSISDSDGNAYQAIGVEQHSTAFGIRSRLFYAANVRGGVNAITSVVSGAPRYHELYVHEYAGLDRVSPLDGFSVSVGAGLAFTSGAVTTSAANALLYGIEIDSNLASGVDGWTTRATLNGNIVADAVASDAGAYAFAGRSSGAYIAWLVAFKLAVAASEALPETPPPAAAPVISAFSAVPATITAGSTATLSWSVSNATSVTIDHGVGDVTGLTAVRVTPTSTVTYTLTATNDAGVSSSQTPLTVEPVTPPPPVPSPSDTEAPSVPSGLSSFQSGSQIDLSWLPSTDNVAVAGYAIYRDGVLIGSTGATAYADTGLSAGTSYVYTVAAYDAIGNTSDKSAGLSVRTQSFSSAPYYSTNFQDVGSPLSDNGMWLNGRQVGVDWTDVWTLPGLAHGTQSGSGAYYDDSFAILKGDWGPDQTATGTVRTVNQQAVYEEVELLLRWSVAPHRATGYEVLFSLFGGNPYVDIVRWNGPLGDFTYLASGYLPRAVANGDVVKATINGQIITAFVNDVPVLQAWDDSFHVGSPGIGFFFVPDGSAANTDFGFTSYTATSNAVADAPAIPGDLSATPVSSSEIALAWSASTGVAGPVVGYKIFRDGVATGGTTETTFLDGGLAPSASYSYTVAAYDAHGNMSGQSQRVTATTHDGAGKKWSHVQTVAADSGARSASVSFSTPTTSGNLIVVQVTWSDRSNFQSINDSLGNTFIPIGVERQSSLIGVKSRLFYAPNIRGGPGTITTVVTGSPSYHELYVHEYSGLDPIAPLDGYSVLVGGGPSFTSDVINTSAPHALIYGFEIDSSAGTADSHWTTRSTLNGNVAADANAATPGTYAFTGRSGGGRYIAWIAAFRSAP